MSEEKMPVLFVSHESPLMWDTPSLARTFLQNLGKSLPRPKAILVISAHWQEANFHLSGASTPKTIHDFGGFPEEYYSIQYPAHGSMKYAELSQNILFQKGIEATIDPNRGLDHAVWLPLGLMYPNAEVPVLSMSIKPSASPKEHYEAGLAIKKLRNQGVLIIGSGTATHNLRPFFSGEKLAIDSPPDQAALNFSDWLKKSINKRDQILQYKLLAPRASLCHPTADHFMPLIVAMGAGDGNEANCIHESFNYSHFAMTSFAWA